MPCIGYFVSSGHSFIRRAGSGSYSSIHCSTFGRSVPDSPHQGFDQSYPIGTKKLIAIDFNYFIIITQLIGVQVVTKPDYNIFPEYLLPYASHLSTDKSVAVRVCFAGCITYLAENAQRFLEISQVFI